MSHHIDKIFYINLDKRTDRREEIEADLVKYNLEAERFSGIYHDPGIVGCGKSHLAVMKLAKERGYKNVLILEDDFTFLMPKEELEQALDTFFTSGMEYDVCMLCCNIVHYEEEQPTPYLRRIIEASNASAYIINGNYLDKIIELYEWALPLLEETGMHWVYANDQVWKSLQKTDKWFVFHPRLGKQKSGYSDNAKRFMDYDT
jgi:glycosyl transferase family 25